MKAKALLTVVAGMVLAGCSLRGKPAKSAVAPAAPKPVVAPAPAAPRPVLSISQTRVELPKPQPVDPAAFVTEPRPPELPEPPPAVVPARPRRSSPATAQPASPAAAAPATATTPPGPRPHAAPPPPASHAGRRRQGTGRAQAVLRCARRRRSRPAGPPAARPARTPDDATA